MKTVLPWSLVAALLFILWSKSCEPKEPEKITITVPKIEGEMDRQEPSYVPPPDTVYVTKWWTAEREIKIETQNPVNDSLATAYQNVKDSLERYKLYLNAIQIRKFKNTFEDENLDLTITGEVQGELRYLKPDYTIKEQQLEIPDPTKKTYLRFLVGAEIQSSVNLEGLNFSAGVGVQNSKGHIFKVGYSKIADRDYFTAGYYISLLNLRR